MEINVHGHYAQLLVGETHPIDADLINKRDRKRMKQIVWTTLGALMLSAGLLA